MNLCPASPRHPAALTKAWYATPGEPDCTDDTGNDPKRQAFDPHLQLPHASPCPQQPILADCTGRASVVENVRHGRACRFPCSLRGAYRACAASAGCAAWGVHVDGATSPRMDKVSPCMHTPAPDCPAFTSPAMAGRSRWHRGRHATLRGSLLPFTDAADSTRFPGSGRRSRGRHRACQREGHALSTGQCRNDKARTLQPADIRRGRTACATTCRT